MATLACETVDEPQLVDLAKDQKTVRGKHVILRVQAFELYLSYHLWYVEFEARPKHFPEFVNERSSRENIYLVERFTQSMIIKGFGVVRGVFEHDEYIFGQ